MNSIIRVVNRSIKGLHHCECFAIDAYFEPCEQLREGTGNVPTDPDALKMWKAFCDNNEIVIFSHHMYQRSQSFQHRHRHSYRLIGRVTHRMIDER